MAIDNMSFEDMYGDEAPGDAQTTAGTATKEPDGDIEAASTDEGNPGSDNDGIDELAAELGFDPDEIKLFRSKGTLEKRIAEAAKAQGKLDDEPAPKSKPEPPKPAEPINIEGFPDFGAEGEEEYDPKIVQLSKAAQSQIAKLQQERDQLQNQLDRLSAAAAVSRFDRLVANAPKEYLDDLGGPIESDELPADSPALQNRIKLFREIEALDEVYSKKGQQLTRKELFERALKNVIGNKNATPGDIMKKLLEKRKPTTVSRPAPRRAPVSPDQREQSALERIAQMTGLPIEEDGSDKFL